MILPKLKTERRVAACEQEGNTHMLALYRLLLFEKEKYPFFMDKLHVMGMYLAPKQVILLSGVELLLPVDY